tara:strand:+ start:1324 stop:2121 length:798 start_codon:yes stop_codon:yes gene_type:complete
MAKKKKEVLVEEPVQVKNTSPRWEMKDRQYYLKKDGSPLTYVLQSKSSRKKPLLWWDEEKGENREIRYSTNQKSPFVDEQDKNVMLSHIIFEDGVLFVPKQKQALQKLLSLYHPKKGLIYDEVDNIAEAKEDLIDIETEMKALNTATSIEIDQAEAILRVELGSTVDKMSSAEIKRDLYLFARQNPVLFLNLVSDENVVLRNLAIKANESGIIKLSQDQRRFTWGSNDRKLMEVPFDENPYSAFAAWLKTDEGVEVYKSIQKKLN